jgi:hypothetical protein
MVEIDDRAALAQMRIAQHLGGVEHRTARDAASANAFINCACVAAPSF